MQVMNWCVCDADLIRCCNNIEISYCERLNRRGLQDEIPVRNEQMSSSALLLFKTYTWFRKKIISFFYASIFRVAFCLRFITVQRFTNDSFVHNSATRADMEKLTDCWPSFVSAAAKRNSYRRMLQVHVPVP